VTHAQPQPLPGTPFGGLFNIAKESVIFLTVEEGAQKRCPDREEREEQSIPGDTVETVVISVKTSQKQEAKPSS